MVRGRYLVLSAALVAGTALSAEKAAAQAIPPGLLPRLLSGPAAQSGREGGAFATVLTTLNAGFFAQGSSVTSVPGDAKVNQVGEGVWLRGNAGLFDIQSTGTALGQQAAIRARTTYAGVQAGVDLGNFNIQGTGFNVIYGVTGGEVNVNASASGDPGSADYSVPFIGAYVVASKGGFVAEGSYRHDFFSATIFAPNEGLLGKSVSSAADTGSVSLSYKYKLPSAFFIEGSAAFQYSRLTTDSFSVPSIQTGLAANLPQTISGTFQALPVNSDLGRAGLRVGKSFDIGGVVVEPFVAASVWREFANPNTVKFTTNPVTVTVPVQGVPIPVSKTIPPQVVLGSVTRVGTFGQYSAGFSSVVTKGLLIFARGDLRSGEHLQGNAVTGGFRYSF